MSKFTQTARIDPSGLAQELTLQEVLERLNDLQQSDDVWKEAGSNTGEAGVDKTVFTSTSVGASITRWLTSVVVTCNRDGKITILKNGTEDIGGADIVAGDNNQSYLYVPGEKLVTTENVVVKFKQCRGSDALVRVYARGLEKT